MKADYKNWMPKGMVLGFLGGAAAALVITLVIGCSPIFPAGTSVNQCIRKKLYEQ